MSLYDKGSPLNAVDLFGMVECLFSLFAKNKRNRKKLEGRGGFETVRRDMCGLCSITCANGIEISGVDHSKLQVIQSFKTFVT